jgi:hypothetical protein
MKDESFVLQCYSAQELADLYQINIKTFKKWLTPFTSRIGEKAGRYYTIAQVKIIVECLGVPQMMISQ